MADPKAPKGPIPVTRWMGLGIEIGLSMVIPVLAGRWADSYFDIRPYGIVLGALFGFISIFWNLYKISLEK